MVKVRKNKEVTINYDGLQMTIKDLLKFSTVKELNAVNLYNRIVLGKWDVDKALSTPVRSISTKGNSIKRIQNTQEELPQRTKVSPDHIQKALKSIQQKKILQEKENIVDAAPVLTISLTKEQHRLLTEAKAEQGVSWFDVLKQGLGIPTECSFIAYYSNKDKAFALKHFCSKKEAEEFKQIGDVVFSNYQDAKSFIDSIATRQR